MKGKGLCLECGETFEYNSLMEYSEWLDKHGFGRCSGKPLESLEEGIGRELIRRNNM